MRKRLERTIGAKNSSKRRKYYNNFCTMTLDSVAESERNELEEELKRILKTYDYEPEKILEYISSQGTSVYRTNKAKFLYLFNENEGFIYPQKGIFSMFLSLISSYKLSFKTKEMFLLSKDGQINKYYFIYHLYNWYAFKHGIAGLDSESQKLLKKFFIDSSDEEIKKLQLSEIYMLKDAIKQDKLAIEFVYNLCKEYEGAKKALEKVKTDGASI